MGEIKGYTADETAKAQKITCEKLFKESCRLQQNIQQKDFELKELKYLYEQALCNYRRTSVNRVLDWIRSQHRQGGEVDIDTYLCHCQNKLNGNIDGLELDLRCEVKVLYGTD